MTPRRRTAVIWSALLLIGCSDRTDPNAAGTFTAQLSGVRTGQLSGTAQAGPSSTELGVTFDIRMFSQRGGKTPWVVLECPGAMPPAIGTHPLGPDQECQGRYYLVVPDSAAGMAVSEQAEADDGSLQITAANEEGVNGSFAFHGTLAAQADTAGVLTTAGTFRAKAF